MNNASRDSDQRPQASIKDVARRAGVSIATVSRCLNDPGRVREETRARVLQAVADIGYSPNTLAQSFRRGKTHVIMVVLPSIGDPFFTGVMQGIRAVARDKGYSILINETQFNTLTDDEVGAMVVSRQADGIALLATLSPYGTRILSARSQRRIPMVIGCETLSPELDELPGVHIDNAAAAREATGFLIGQGHRDIAFITGDEDSLLTRDREAGFRQGMREAGLAIPEGRVREGSMTIEGALRATRELLAEPPRPTAIFCANDEMALACMHAVKASGLAVPGDVSVMGFDDVRYAAISDPPLTTVSQPAAEIGRCVMERLISEIENGCAGARESLVLPHRLVVRQSVAAVQ